MNRKLVLLNLLLVAMLAGAGWQIRERWRQAREREQAILSQKTPPASAPAVPQTPAVSPVPASNLLDVAQKMVFSRDRNPNVVIEEKPPEPDPAFPIIFGFFDLGGGPTVFMTEKAGGTQKGYHVGDVIGPFKISALSATNITLQWKQKTFEKKLTDLKAKAAQQAQSPEAQTAERPPQPGEVRANDAAEGLKRAQETMSSSALPGLDIGASARACAPGDSASPGAVQGGFRKVVTATPFGQNCRWEPVR